MTARRQRRFKNPRWGEKGGSFQVSDNPEVIESVLSAPVWEQGLMDKQSLRRLSLELGKAGIHIGFSALSAGKDINHSEYHYTMEDPQAMIFTLSGSFARAGMGEIGDIRDLVQALDSRGISFITPGHPVIEATREKNRQISTPQI